MDTTTPQPLRDRAAETLRSAVAAMPRGAARGGQAAMCAAAADLIEHADGGEPRHLTVAAGTGTGKSLAYLAAAVAAGRPVVIATATKALQDQLLHHDVPAVAEGLGRPVAAATLKGRGSYLCRQKADELLAARRRDGTITAATPTAADEIDRLLQWAATTGSGDEADLPFAPTREAWAELSTDSSECPGASRCPAGQTCHAERAKQRAAAADVVIVNQHLYLLSSRVGMENLPPHSTVIIDEAHELESAASSVFGVTVNAARFRRLRDNAANHIDKATAETLRTAADALLDALADRVGLPFTERLPPPPDVAAAAEAAASVIAAVADDLAIAVRDHADSSLPGLDPDGSGSGSLPGGSAEQQLRRASAAADSLHADLRIAADPGPGWASWAEQTGPRSRPQWRIAPADVATLLHEAVWEHTSAVLTSATVPPGHERSVGLDIAGTHTLIDVGSPFDYRSSLLYCPPKMPRPGRPGWNEALRDETAGLVEAAGGRALVLCTSWKTVHDLTDHLRVTLPHLPVLSQNDHPKPELMRRFAAEHAACLVGTLGLWQGVDVPGESLSLTVITRLPFPRPDDPLTEARRALAGDNAFHAVDLPITATRLAQGAGRLIRSETDRGVVAVLDPRLATARYRTVILDAMPPFKRTIDRSHAVAALNEIRDRHSVPAAA